MSRQRMVWATVALIGGIGFGGTFTAAACLPTTFSGRVMENGLFLLCLQPFFRLAIFRDVPEEKSWIFVGILFAGSTLFRWLIPNPSDALAYTVVFGVLGLSVGLWLWSKVTGRPMPRGRGWF